MRFVVLAASSVALLGATLAAAPRSPSPGAVRLPPCVRRRPGALPDSSRVYDSRDVDKPSVGEPGNPTAPWPGTADQSPFGTVATDQRDAASASVVAQFIVDTLGCVDSASFRVVVASDSAFVRSVLGVVSRLRYTPARKGGRKVRSLVLWKFVFYRRNGSGFHM